MSARRKKRRIPPGLSPHELRQRGRRALAKARAWMARAEELFREADRREATADDAALGPEPWPAENCATCIAGRRCALHGSRIDTEPEPAP